MEATLKLTKFGDDLIFISLSDDNSFRLSFWAKPIKKDRRVTKGLQILAEATSRISLWSDKFIEDESA